MNVFLLILIAIVSYLLGNFSCGIIVARMLGHIDIREHGSGNAGTTNVLRTLGWLPSVCTLVGDALKAFAAAMLGKLLAGVPGMLLGGFCALAGHNWPIFLGFRGGKGIAPALGMILAIHPVMALSLLAIEIIIVGTTGYMSIASLANVVLYPIATAIAFHSADNFAMYMVFSILTAAAVGYSHRANVKRLLNHSENRLEFKKIKFMKK